MRVFTLLFGLSYFTAFYMEWALFRYYPETGAFHIDVHPEEGPAILWYGWLATAGLVSAAIGAVVPRGIVDKMPPSLLWIVPVATTIGMCIFERRWFL